MTDAARLAWLGLEVILPSGRIGTVVGLEAGGPRLLVQWADEAGKRLGYFHEEEVKVIQVMA